jgi:uncharacterized protein (DUF305 family)
MRLRIYLIAGAAVLLIGVSGCGGDSRHSGPMEPGQMGSGTNGAGMPGGMSGSSMMIASEFDYLTRMIPHHEEAVTAAKVLLRGTQREEMRTFAISIIETQSSEIAAMQAWLAAWYSGRDTRVSYQPMMRNLTGLTGETLDRAFLQDMIPHHMMAVMMSQQLLLRPSGVHAEIVPFATRIRDAQRAEIQTMQEWLREWFGTFR